MTNSTNLISEFNYDCISISDFFKFGQSKIDKIIKSSNLNNINLIQTDGKFIYHLRYLNQKEEDFTNPKWFVHNPHDLLVIFLYRMWQNDDCPNNKIDIKKFNFYKENLYVDVYYTKKPLYLLKFDNQKYYQLENILQTIDPKYEKCYDETDNFQVAKWFRDNEKTIGLDGWFEESNNEIKQQNFKRIDEIMVLPSSSHKLDLIYTERIDKIIDFGILIK